METRDLNISINKKSGSTASKNSLSYRLVIPTVWMKKMGITQEDKQVEVSYEDKEIIIRKKS